MNPNAFVDRPPLGRPRAGLMPAWLLGLSLVLSACGGSDAPEPVPAAPATFTVTANAGTGGSLSPAATQVLAGGQLDLQVQADAGYRLASVSGCGGSVDGTGQRYTIGAVSADCAVTAVFEVAAPTQRTVTGVVVDAQGLSLPDVLAYTAAGELARSDASGRLSFSLPVGGGQAVRLSKPGYTRQTVVLQAGTGQASFVGTLGRSAPPITVSIDQPVDLIDPQGARVSLAPGTVVNRAGQVVSGNIQVSITPVDVSDDRALKVFPGRFEGELADGSPAHILMPYGTMEVNLSQDGEPLNLAAGSVAAIEIPIFVTEHPDGTAITVGQAQQNVWSLDEDTGLWRWEAEGVVVASERSPTGLALRSQVSHFSWWNYDYYDSEPPPNPGGRRVRSCEVPISLVNLPVGSGTVQAELIGLARTRARYATAQSLTDGQTVRIPSGISFALVGTTTLPDGRYYRASAVFSCASPSGVSLVFGGPLPPLIQDYEAAIAPVFGLDSTGRHEVMANRATLTWTVVGHKTLNLIEASLPMNTPLAVAMGSLTVDLPAPADPINNPFTFTLSAFNDLGAAQLQKTLTYLSAPAPQVQSFYYHFQPGDPLTITWTVDGADDVVLGSVPIGSPPEAMTRIRGLSGTTATFSPALLPSGGIGQQVVLAFRNQYGSSYRAFTYGTCFQNPDGSCAATD